MISKTRKSTAKLALLKRQREEGKPKKRGKVELLEIDSVVQGAQLQGCNRCQGLISEKGMGGQKAE